MSRLELVERLCGITAGMSVSGVAELRAVCEELRYSEDQPRDEYGKFIAGAGEDSKTYDVYIHKAYFPDEIKPKGIGKEDFEQWKVKAGSRKEAAEKIWKEHGDRLLGLMNPHQGSLPRKVSLYVNDPKTGAPPGRLQSILVHEDKK